MPHSDVFPPSPSNLRLPDMLTVPSAEDLAFALNLARKNPHNIVELPWTITNGPAYTLKVTCGLSLEEPRWMLNIGSQWEQTLLWSYDTADYNIVHTLLVAECNRVLYSAKTTQQQNAPPKNTVKTEAVSSSANDAISGLAATISAIDNFAGRAKKTAGPGQVSPRAAAAAAKNQLAWLSTGEALDAKPKAAAVPPAQQQPPPQPPQQPPPPPPPPPPHIAPSKSRTENVFPMPQSELYESQEQTLRLGKAQITSPGEQLTQVASSEGTPAHQSSSLNAVLAGAQQMEQNYVRQQSFHNPWEPSTPPPEHNGQPGLPNIDQRPGMFQATDSGTYPTRTTSEHPPYEPPFGVPFAPFDATASGNNQPYVGRDTGDYPPFEAATAYPGAPETPQFQPQVSGSHPSLPAASSEQEHHNASAHSATVRTTGEYQSYPPDPTYPLDPNGNHVHPATRTGENPLYETAEQVQAGESPRSPNAVGLINGEYPCFQATITGNHNVFVDEPLAESQVVGVVGGGKRKELPPPLDFDRPAVDSIWKMLKTETGLVSQAAFMFFLMNEATRHQLTGHDVSLVRFDMCVKYPGPEPLIKPLPNRAVKEAAKRILVAQRPLAIIGHYGTSSYCMLLPHCSASQAEAHLQSLHTALTNRALVPGMDPNSMTFFFGLASMPEDCEHPGVLLACAEQALTYAKRNGQPFAAFATIE